MCIRDRSTPLGILKLSFIFTGLGQWYEEILNVREFTLDSLFANIGGYAGMFFGFSLFQGVDIIVRQAKKIKDTILLHLR